MKRTLIFGKATDYYELDDIVQMDRNIWRVIHVEQYSLQGKPIMTAVVMESLTIKPVSSAHDVISVTDERPQ